MKTCIKCGHQGALEEFVAAANLCKPCKKEYTKAWNLANPEKRKASRVRERSSDATKKRELRRRARNAGQDPDFIEAYYSAHSKRCDICGSPRGIKDLAIDHDHATGVFRGLLCVSCNNGLGRFKDDVNLLEAAVKYLKNTPGDLGRLLK